jgi:DNA polymerase-1
VGFANFLLALWDTERPSSVVVGFDSLDAPTYRNEALPGYQAGRVFDDAIVEQLALLPGLVEAFGFAVAKAPGYEADDFLAAAAAAAWTGPVSLVTSDRDAFQLVSERVSVLQPVRGVSELTRVGPAEVRARYDVDPEQVPDFIALRGDPSDRIPGAPGVGPKMAASLLARYGTLEAALEDGRFAAIADDLRLYRRVARMDAAAPLPTLHPLEPDWQGAHAHAQQLGLGGLARRLAERV